MHIEKGSRVVVSGNVSVGEVEERVELAGCHSVMATAEGGRSWDKKLIGRGGEEGAATSTSKRGGRATSKMFFDLGKPLFLRAALGRS